MNLFIYLSMFELIFCGLKLKEEPVFTLSEGHRRSLSLPGWVQIFLFELGRLLVFHRKDECKGKFSRIEDAVVNSWTTILLVPLALFWQQPRKWIQILLNPDLIVAFEGEFQILHDLLWVEGRVGGPWKFYVGIPLENWFQNVQPSR